jgi:hypothetical protein
LDVGGKGIFGLPDSKTTPAHPRLKITPCPSCNHPHCNPHGHYFRKGTHLFFEIIVVPRFLCPRAHCRATHSILPENTLPICRWRLRDILDIAVRFSNGETAYAISKGIGESESSLRRLKVWMAKATEVIAALARELEPLAPTPPAPPPTSGAGLTLAYRWPTWAAFTHAFSRTLYPKRFPLSVSHTILTG